MEKRKILVLGILGLLLFSCALSYHLQKIDQEVNIAVQDYAQTSRNFYVVNCMRYMSQRNCEELLIGLPITKEQPISSMKQNGNY